MAESQLVRGLSHQVASQLRDNILAGSFADGERLSETMLSERFGVSRGPIREALIQLSQEGLVESKPHYGVRVAAAPPNEIQQLLLPIRRTVEVYALKLYYRDLAEPDFRELDQILHQLHDACQRDDVADVTVQDLAFHRWVVARAGQSDLLTVWSTIASRLRPHFRSNIQHWYASLIDVYTEHAALVEVLRAGNGKAAAKAFKDHIRW